MSKYYIENKLFQTFFGAIHKSSKLRIPELMKRKTENIFLSCYYDNLEKYHKKSKYCMKTLHFKKVYNII